MKNNGTNRGPLLGGALKALGLAGVLGALFIFGLMMPMYGLLEGLSGGNK